MFSVFEQQLLQRPVKIVYFVYCAFDSEGNTLERQWGEIKWISFLPEKNSHMSHFLIAEHCVSRVLVLLYCLINCWNRLFRAEDVGGKSGKERERREDVCKGMQWGYPASINAVAIAKYTFWIMIFVIHLPENVVLKTCKYGIWALFQEAGVWSYLNDFTE